MPITVSAPNQVAKVVVTTMISGRLRPAMAKSLVFLMRVPAQTPRPSVPSKYNTTQVISVVFMWFCPLVRMLSVWKCGDYNVRNRSGRRFWVHSGLRAKG